MRQIFASAMGQYDNLGDTVLRRPFLRTLRDLGPLNVFVGSRPDTYLSALGLDGSERLYRDSSSWRAALGRNMTLGEAVFAFNAGEIEVTRPYAAHYLRLAPLLLANKIRGGRAIHAGLGVRRSTSWVPAVRSTLKLVDDVSWRDPFSQSVMGIGGVAPDWAFAEGSDNNKLAQRAAASRADTMVFAPRYNGRLPDTAWMNGFKEASRRLGLRIVVAAQIERDNDVSRILAKRWGGEAILWSDADHASQEARLRATYAQTRLIVSERLHGLVIAATEGAVPVALGTAPTDKALRTVAGAGLTPYAVSADEFSEASHQQLAKAAAANTRLAQEICTARESLGSLQRRIEDVIRG